VAGFYWSSGATLGLVANCPVGCTIPVRLSDSVFFCLPLSVQSFFQDVQYISFELK